VRKLLVSKFDERISTMISYRMRGVAVLHSIMTAIAAVGVFWMWTFLYFVVLRSQAPVSYHSYGIYSLLLVVGVGANHFICRFNSIDLLQVDFLGALRLSLRQTLTILGVIVLYLFAFKDAAMSRVFLFTLIPILCGVLVEVNAKMPRFLASGMFQKRRRQPTILFGTPGQLDVLTTWLQNKAPYGLDVIGIITDDKALQRSAPWPVLGRMAEFEDILHTTGATQVIALHLPNSLSRASRLGQLCDSRGVRLIFVNDIDQKFKRSVRFFEDGGVRLVSLREEPLECPFNRVIKRVLDLAISLPVILFVLPPITLAVYLIQRWQSPGPLFFKQKRTGLHFTPFDIIKFRTMHVSNPDETRQATAEDPRVFPLGRWLRKLSIDELPQFINVFRGDMSIVGPRPHMIEHNDQFEKTAEFYRVRSLVRPGITGLAQVKGHRGETRHANDIIDRVRSDVYYLEHWSLGLDWAIIFRTGWQLLRPPKTAY